MAADRKPLTRSLLSHAYGLATRLVLRYPHATLALAILAGVISLVYAAVGLGYRTSRHDLVNSESDYSQNWNEYINEFGDEDDAVIVVEGPGREQVVPVLEEISVALSHEQNLFHAILHEVDLSKIRSKGLHYLPPEDLLNLEQFLTRAVNVVDGDWSRLNLSNLFSGMAHQAEAAAASGAAGGQHPTTGIPGPPTGNMSAAEGQKELERLTESLLTVLTRKRRYQSPWPEMPQAFATLSELSSEYLLTKDGQLGFVLLRLTPGEDGFARGTTSVEALRKLIGTVSARHPDIKVGLTGVPIMENDEMQSSQSSMMLATAVSLIGVALLFIAGFGGIRHPLLANLILLIGMAWAFGYVTLAIGHLNILSVAFTVTLIGIGIDYGVHYVARYLQLRQEGMACHAALVECSASVSPAITTGAVTTAVAFFAAGLTSFTGVAELGMIAGGGILLIAIAELAVLPAAIYLMDRDRDATLTPAPLPVWLATDLVVKGPRFFMFATLVITCVVTVGISQLYYDHNLLNMQAEGLESVELEHKLLAESDQSVWYALSIADSRDELLQRKQKFLALPTVQRVEEIVSMLPPEHEVKQPIIERIADRLATLPERPPLLPVDRPEDLGQVLGRLQQMLALQGGSSRCALQLEQIRDTLRRLPLNECYALLSGFQQQMAGDLLSRLHTLKRMANPQPPKLSDLPPSLVDRFVGQHGRHLLKIYGRGNIWDMDALTAFVKDVRSVDSKVTGNPLQAYNASLEMKSSYEHAAVYALVIILTVLLIDFRSLRYAGLAAAPLAVGMLQMFGLLGLLDLPLNPANMIALPVIMGIGIDYGVHIVHDYREQRGRFRLNPSTAVAVVIDSLTTIVGFGSLMLASHRGLQSLGRVLVIGLSCCLFTSLVMLPALLAWLSRNRVDEPETPPEPPEPADLEEITDPRQLTSILQARVLTRWDPQQEQFVAPHSPGLPEPEHHS